MLEAEDLRNLSPSVRQVIEQLVRDGSMVARSDGTRHSIFPVAASPAEG